MTAYKPRFSNLVELFQQSVDRFAERRAFGFQRGREWQFITYAELDGLVAKARAAQADWAKRSLAERMKISFDVD